MFQLLVHAAGLAPAARLVWLGTHAGLTANPVQFVQDRLGDWALNFLVLTLCMTPLARLTKDSRWTKARRAVGLYAFFYALLHFLSWLWLDKEFDWGEMLRDIEKRRWILVGFSSLVLMAPLAITSTKGWIRRLGKNWGRLHTLTYPAAVLACVHYLWQVKLDRRWPLTYLGAIAALLLYRVWHKAVTRPLQTP